MDKQRFSKTQELFDLALEMNISEQEKFLNEMCKDDQELKNEVLSLLKSFNNNDDFLEKPLELTAETSEILTDPFIGKQIGKYIIDSEAGFGGMGVVYAGYRNDKEFEQKVAIKILKHGITSDYLLKRFQIERQTLANLQHRFIAKLLDGGSTDDGLPYLVMEYIEGTPITEYCGKNKLSIDGQIELFRKVCMAVQYAHQNLIIHRDIKPGNILVINDGTPKLLDFGIAKLIDEDLIEEDGGLTKTGVWHLTPEYSSPEQINGSRITTASDIYSLGVLLYKLLTGEQPYRIKNLSPIAISKFIEKENITKPSDKVKQKIETNSGNDKTKFSEVNYEKNSLQLKGDLDNIILKAMDKDPERRYASVQQFSEDLNRYLIGLPVIAQKDTTTYRLSKFIRRHKIGFSSSVGFALLLIFSLIAISWQANIASKERDKTRLEAQKTEAVNTFLQGMLSSVDPSEIGRDVKVYDILEKAGEDIETNLKDQPEVEASLRSTLGNTYVNLGEYDKAKPFLDDALAINKKIYGNESKETAYSLHDLGLYFDWVGDYKKADSIYSISINILRKVLQHPTKQFSNVLNDQALIKMYYGKNDAAKKLFNEALDVALQSHGEKDKNTAVIMNNLALNYTDAGDLDKAEKYYKKSLSINIELLGENRPEVGTIYNNLAYLYSLKKDYKLAEEYLEKSYKLKLNLKGKDHPDVGLALNNLGVINIRMGNYDKAEKYQLDALKQYRKTLDSDHPYIALSQYWLGKIYLETGKFDIAEGYLRKSLKTRIKKFPAENKDIWRSKSELGICLLKQKKYSEAEKLITTSLEFYKSNFKDDSTQIKRLYKNVVDLYNSTGNKRNADNYSEELNNYSKENISE